MKLSRFLVFFPFTGDQYLVYQTATQAILLLSKEVLFGLLEGKINDLPEDYVSELRRNFILVEDDCDELSIYEYLMYLGKFNVRGLNYVIVTTYNCNIECTYCYQRDIRIDSPMSIETANKVADFILSQRAEFNTKDVHLTWYGGEPLLNMKAIVIIGERLSDEGLNIGSSIITNGTLLTKENLEKLMKYNLQTVQITIDGPPQVHNKRRPIKGGKPSFDLIYRNLKEVVPLVPEGTIGVRVNVDKTNIEYIPKLLHMLRDDHLNNRIGIGFGRTWSYGLCEYTWAFSAEEFGKYFVPLMKLAIENEFKLLSVKIPFNILGCGAYTINTLIVDPLGNLYKCWDLLGDPRYSVGNIDNGINISKHAEWILRSPSKSEACKKCSFLPACGGGCAALSIREGKSLKDFTCIDVKYFIKEWLKLYLYLSNLLDDKLLSF